MSLVCAREMLAIQGHWAQDLVSRVLKSSDVGLLYQGIKKPLFIKVVFVHDAILWPKKTTSTKVAASYELPNTQIKQQF